MKNANEAADALAEFVTERSKVQWLLLQLQEAFDGRLGAAMGSVHWGHVGDAKRLRAKLEEALALAEGRGA